MAFIFLVLFLAPALGSVVNGLILRPRDVQKSGAIATGMAALSFLCALCLSIAYSRTGALTVGWEWFGADSYHFGWEFHWDALTTVMGLAVTGIGTLIHLYSIGYMSEEPSPYRYFSYLNLFLASMLLLITGNTLLVTFVGWEGVGVCSYLLISYWFEDPQKAAAGMKAFILNRIGDLGFLLAIFVCFHVCHAVDYPTLNAMARSGQLNSDLANLIGVLLFVGAMGKSAQIPLYVWLPDAMAGPTPVSALIHAATMVTAGVYLVARLGFLFEMAPLASGLVVCIGMATSLLTASIALVQRDIKKILAYSTVSQLGLMFVGLGVGNYFSGIFHVFTHAFFKALLFLGAGSVIHAVHGEQDIFKMGGLREKMPWTFWTFTIGTAAICGVPPLAGFFSKDTILHAASQKSFFLGILGLGVSLLTAFYMSRLYFLTFFGKYRGSAHPHESPQVMTVPLVILAVGSALVGFLGLPHILGHNVLEHFLSLSLPTHGSEHHEGEVLSMLLAITVAAMGIGYAYRLYGKGISEKKAAKSKQEKLGYRLLWNKYWVDEIYDRAFVVPFRRLSLILASWFDKSVIDAALLWPASATQVGARVLSSFQSGLVQFYLLLLAVGAVLTFWICLKGMVV